MWGTDLSGTMQGAGGVGGSLAVSAGTNGTHFTTYDGNGNIVALVNATNGTCSGRFDYGPFGEAIRAEGTPAVSCPMRLSTKYEDIEADFVYYGYRYYNSTTARWLNRDPLEEKGGLNTYAFVANDAVNGADALGLWKLYDSFKSGTFTLTPAILVQGLIRQLLPSVLPATDGELVNSVLNDLAPLQLAIHIGSVQVEKPLGTSVSQHCCVYGSVDLEGSLPLSGILYDADLGGKIRFEDCKDYGEEDFVKWGMGGEIRIGGRIGPGFSKEVGPVQVGSVETGGFLSVRIAPSRMTEPRLSISLTVSGEISAGVKVKVPGGGVTFAPAIPIGPGRIPLFSL